MQTLSPLVAGLHPRVREVRLHLVVGLRPGEWEDWLYRGGTVIHLARRP